MKRVESCKNVYVAEVPIFEKAQAPTYRSQEGSCRRGRVEGERLWQKVEEAMADAQKDYDEIISPNLRYRNQLREGRI
jgi:hypothetical protein